MISPDVVSIHTAELLAYQYGWLHAWVVVLKLCAGRCGLVSVLASVHLIRDSEGVHRRAVHHGCSFVWVYNPLSGHLLRPAKLSGLRRRLVEEWSWVRFWPRTFCIRRLYEPILNFGLL